MKKDTNKSLIDNPLENMGDLVNINSVTGRRFSKEAIEENNAEINKTKDILKDVKENVITQKPLTDKENKTLESVIERVKNEASKIENKEEKLEDTITSYEKDFKEIEEESNSLTADSGVKPIYIKKTYIINQYYIDLIEGLSLYTGKERKKVVEELLKKATDLIAPSIKEKALKELKKSKKNIDTKEIF